LTLKGKHGFVDFNLLPQNWGALFVSTGFSHGSCLSMDEEAIIEEDENCRMKIVEKELQNP